MATKVRAHVRRFEVQLEGAAVGEGEVDFDALVAFGEHFQDALRRLANVVEGRQAVKPGHPTTAATAAAKFRLVGIKKGSAILQLRAASDDLWPSAADMALVELSRRAHAPKAPLERGIVDALEEARLSLGGKGGFRVKSHGMKTLVVNERSVGRLRLRAVERAGVDLSTHVISGWLHMADLQPNEFVIRAPTGIEWRCTFEQAMKQRVLNLLDHVVVARGTGSYAGRVGRLDIESIEEAAPVLQQTLEGNFDRLMPPDVPTTTRLRQQAQLGPEITRKDVDDLLAAIEELEPSR